MNIISNIPYISDSFFEYETRIWRNSWILVGREADLNEKGKFITFDISTINVSVFIVRESSGELRAFYNLFFFIGTDVLTIMRSWPLDAHKAEWGNADAHQRLSKRSDADYSDIKKFYAAVVPRLEQIMEFLNQYPVNDIPDQFKPLAYMALATCEVDDPVNIWGSSELMYISNAKNWWVKRSFNDYSSEVT